MNHATIITKFRNEQAYATKLGLILQTDNCTEGEPNFRIADTLQSTFDLRVNTIEEVECFLEGYSRAKDLYDKPKKDKRYLKEGDHVIVTRGLHESERGYILSKNKYTNTMWDVRLKNEKVIAQLPSHCMTLDPKKGKK
jgi:hypothetical protein